MKTIPFIPLICNAIVNNSNNSFTKEESEQLIEELRGFVEQYNERPVVEQADAFMQRYKNLVKLANYHSTVTIEKNTTFIKNFLFVMMLVIPLTAAVITAYYMWL